MFLWTSSIFLIILLHFLTFLDILNTFCLIYVFRIILYIFVHFDWIVHKIDFWYSEVFLVHIGRRICFYVPQAHFVTFCNTPGTAGGPGGRDLTPALKSAFFRKKIRITPQFFFAYIFLFCQNIGGEIISNLGVSPKWVKAKDGEKRKRRERKTVRW